MDCVVKESSTEQEYSIITSQCPNTIVDATYPADYKSFDQLRFSYLAFQFAGVEQDTSQVILGCNLKICDFLDFTTDTNACNTEPNC